MRPSAPVRSDFLCLSRRYISVWPENRVLHGISGGGAQSVAAADSMASPRGNGQRREIARFAVQYVSLPRLAFSSFPRRAENRASHTKSSLKHRCQPLPAGSALNDSGGAIRRSPNPALKSRYCFWLFTESRGGKSVAAADNVASPRANGQRREIARLAVQCVSLPRLASSSFPRRVENRASHTKSPLKHRRQPYVLNDSRALCGARRTPRQSLGIAFAGIT